MSRLEPLAYRDGEVALSGLLARPACAARAAIVIFPTIVNINPPMERRAQMLADEGFVVLLADFYGEPVESFEASFPLAERLRGDVDRYRRRIAAAIAALRGHETADGLRVGAIGYCMGGQAALEAARASEDLAFVASFHGILTSGRPATAATPIRPRILVCHGDADPLVPREQVLGFWEEMDAAGADWHFHSYARVRHGFTDPDSDSRGMEAIRYDRSADRQSWAALLGFAAEAFGG